MMFTPPRFIVIDDKQAHLAAIVQTFQSMGAPCAGIFYDGTTGLDPELFRGVRGLFLDLHLLQGTLSTDHKQHYAQIASILEDNIGPDGGPFVLVIWTELAHLAPELAAYLDANLDAAKPHTRPLAVMCLEKEKYISLETGAVQHPQALREAVENAIHDKPPLAALLSWETEIMNATGSTLAALLTLVEPQHRTMGQYPGAMSELLSRLAIAAVGRPNVPSDRRSAITAALAPILVDRIQRGTVSKEIKALWDQAVNRDQDGSLSDLGPVEAGKVNRMLHIALPGTEQIRPYDWGAVVDLPEEWLVPDAMKSRFGAKARTILGGEFKICDHDNRGLCRFRLVRVGAVCDYSQGQSGPIPYLLGLEIPVEVARPQGFLRKAEWLTPVIVVDSSPFHLAVNCRYLVTVPKSETEKWTTVYRLREQLLMDLIDFAAGYISRPGIVQFRAKITPQPVPATGSPNTAKEMGTEPAVANGGADAAKQAGVEPLAGGEAADTSKQTGVELAAASEAVDTAKQTGVEPAVASGGANTANQTGPESAVPAASNLTASPEQRLQNGSHDGSTDTVAEEPDAIPPSADGQ
jgi:hypothetical protein